MNHYIHLNSAEFDDPIIRVTMELIATITREIDPDAKVIFTDSRRGNTDTAREHIDIVMNRIHARLDKAYRAWEEREKKGEPHPCTVVIVRKKKRPGKSMEDSICETTEKDEIHRFFEEAMTNSCFMKIKRCDGLNIETTSLNVTSEQTFTIELLWFPDEAGNPRQNDEQVGKNAASVEYPPFLLAH